MNGDLASRQAALVAALVSGAPVPSGFDDRLVGVARRALLRKRADDVRRQWPMLAASFGPAWVSTFATWAETRESRGSLRDGWDLARSRAPLAAAAAAELREREALWAYDGASAPRRRGRVSAAARMWWARR